MITFGIIGIVLIVAIVVVETGFDEIESAQKEKNKKEMRRWQVTTSVGMLVFIGCILVLAKKFGVFPV